MLHMLRTEGGGLLETHIMKVLKEPRSLLVEVMQAVEQIQTFHELL
jgi:hypothetical protein